MALSASRRQEIAEIARLYEGLRVEAAIADLLAENAELLAKVEAHDLRIHALSESWLNAAERIRDSKGQRTRPRSDYEVMEACADELSSLLGADAKEGESR